MSLTSNDRRDIPSVDRVVREMAVTDLPRPMVVSIVRGVLMRLRTDPQLDWQGELAQQMSLVRRQRVQPVINATGIIIHTNLGRSPLADEAIAAMSSAARSYTNLEFDLETGERGSRGQLLEQSLSLLCDAEAATVVNNCAAALVLALHHLTRGNRREVIISRGELVQIGGGFRIPDILESAGATLREVGTTNRTSPADYARAMSDRTAMILKVHHSNFLMSGFVESATLQQLEPIARSAGVPLVEDQGSGAVAPTIAGEPTAADSLKAGADLVLFSGDKLLAGPQAGIIVGQQSLVGAMKKEPLFRALRCDKLVFAGLQATVDLLLDGRGDRVPIRRMINTTITELTARADAIAAAVPGLKIVQCQSRIGGGAAPDATIPSVALAIEPSDAWSASGMLRRLLEGATPIIGYIDSDRVLLDLRTVFPIQDPLLIELLRAAIRP